MPTRSYPSFYIYLDKAGEYRWRYQASGNHKTEADSAEGYKELRDCEAGIELVKRGASAPVF
ncbi:MAG: hypothetical protein JWO25_3414, partial [Alphaproteobacteria bacterium]|nr:hypothetical protein [Alphaproteobacteria bacterium]